MITADHSGIVRGQFTLPSDIPAGTKRVEFIGNRGSRGLAQFTGRGEITIEERRRVRVIQRYDPLAQTFTLLNEGRHIAAVGLWFEDIGAQPVTIQIREVSNGVPTGIVLAEKRIDASDIASAGSETIIDFVTPLYLDALQEFAIVVLTDDNAHSLAIARWGNTMRAPSATSQSKATRLACCSHRQTQVHGHHTITPTSHLGFTPPNLAQARTH
ncbi:hypothetical protein [Rappaport israeli]|uniref:hypothetical protein n=1 Tax=Rappaport israeli TaxID=1839807 RepID=UPI000B33CF6C|nr:hypothetical protein [Rappaport israeli]